MNSNADLNAPLTLPCGLTLKNRIVKSAMSDSLGNGAGDPTAAQINLYHRWALGGAALALIGEAQVTPDHPEKPGNLVLHSSADVEQLKALADAGSQKGAHIWPQLGHGGALSHAPISSPKGPSPLDLPGLTCGGMTLAEIDALPDAYAYAAQLAQRVGFSGVQIHAGHGFLLSQFLSPLFNHRTDQYGGSVANRFRVIAAIIAAVRVATGPSFAIGIKINATDMLEGGLMEAEALAVVQLLNSTSVDLIDISGGTYFPGAPASSESSAKGGPYFRDFAREAKCITDIPMTLTGGIKTRAQAVAVLTSGAADAVGLARALVMDPELPNAWIGGEDRAVTFPKFENPPKGSVTAWYTMRLTALGEGTEANFDHSADTALCAYNQRDRERCQTWVQRFD